MIRESPDERDAEAHFSFDDEAAIWVNDRQAFRGNHVQGFEAVRFPVRLRKGRNRILVKLSNQDNDNWRFWGFSWRLE